MIDCAENKRLYVPINRSCIRRSDRSAAVMFKITIIKIEIDRVDKLFMLGNNITGHNCCFHVVDLLSGFSISVCRICSSIPVVYSV